MIKMFLEWLLSFFQKKEEKKIHKEIEEIDDKIKEIEDEKMDSDAMVNYLNSDK